MKLESLNDSLFEKFKDNQIKNLNQLKAGETGAVEDNVRHTSQQGQCDTATMDVSDTNLTDDMVIVPCDSPDRGSEISFASLSFSRF